MLFDIFKAVAGILLLMAVWFAVQAFLRKRTAPSSRDFDVLEDMVHGCGNCGHAGSCSGHQNSKEEIHQCRS